MEVWRSPAESAETAEGDFWRWGVAQTPYAEKSLAILKREVSLLNIPLRSLREMKTNPITPPSASSALSAGDIHPPPQSFHLQPTNQQTN